MVLTVGPGTVMLENWLFYPYPATALLCTGALFLHRFLSGRRTLDGVVFVSMLTALALLLSFFHLIWLVLILAGLVWLQPASRRRTAVLCALPLALVLFWYGKNLVLFRSFSASSWLGFNLGKMVISRTPRSNFRSSRLGTRSALLHLWGRSAP